MDIVTALSGGGPAYLFAIMEAMTDAAVLLGMDRPTARELTVQTLKSAAAMAENRGASFSDLKDMITSPGGTTIAGMRALEKAGVRGTMMDVISAAANRSKELGA
jgi:pyrroline-5-carboxylate reductase